MTAVPVVRRSGRSRKAPTDSVYADAKKAMEEQEEAAAAARLSVSTAGSSSRTTRGSTSTSTRKEHEGTDVDDVEEPTDDDAEDSSQEPDETEEESEDDEEDFLPTTKKSKTPSKQKGTKRASPSPQGAPSPKRVVQVKPKQAPSNRRSPVPRAPRGGARQANRVNANMLTLARKVLHKTEETEDNSILAAVLLSYKHATNRRVAGEEDTTLTKTPLLLMYGGKKGTKSAVPGATTTATTHPTQAAKLEELARKVIALHRRDPNAAQCALLTFLFRSLGGTYKTSRLFDPDEVSLEDMDDETWTKVVTDLVDDMRHAQPDAVLLCADPSGSRAAANSGSHHHATAAENASREYRRIYTEFWRLLALVALSDGGAMTSNADDEESKADDSSLETTSTDSTSKKRTQRALSQPHAGSRFDIELLRDLILRVTELVSVGQPDVRAGATLAALAMGQAILDRTVLLGDKLSVAQRQYDAAIKASSARKSSPKGRRRKTSASGGGEKAESLRNTIDLLKRSRADLEEVATGAVLNGVFMHRYRDSNPHVRVLCMDALSKMTLQRPDLFLCDKYLKYFGWLMSDKEEPVRVAAVSGLLAPFEAHEALYSASNADKDELQSNIDVNQMEHVTQKFLSRIADCTVDVSPRVQECAAKLMLCLLREGFLDELDDDAVWNQINLRALAGDASPAARRDALYFVMEQLEAFDEGEDGEGEDPNRSGSSNKKRNSTALESSERRASQRIDALASWVAHALTDGPMPIEYIRVEYADYVVFSLRDMPEHRHLITDWSALLRAITDDTIATIDGSAAGDRADVAKQRVLMRMLECAARAEVGAVADSSFFSSELDDVMLLGGDGSNFSHAVDIASSRPKGKQAKGGKSSSAGLQHEKLSVALLKALPDLLVKFGSDPAILESLTCLPRYLIPTVFSLPQRKNDFVALVKKLKQIYLQSQDDVVLLNAALSLSYLARGEHSRAPEAKLQLQQIADALKRRVDDLVKEDGDIHEDDQHDKGSPGRKNRRSPRSKNSKSSDKDVAKDDLMKDREYSLSLALKRLRILARRYDLADLMGGEEELEELTTLVAAGLSERLRIRKQDGYQFSDIDSSVHSSIAEAIGEGLDFLLSCTAWRFKVTVEEEGLDSEGYDSDVEMATVATNSDSGDATSDESEKHCVLRLRNRLLALTELCFEQFVPPSNEDVDDDESGRDHSPEQVVFSQSVQSAAMHTACDLRTLFPKELANAARPLLRSLALTVDGKMIGGSVRFFKSLEPKLRAQEEGEGEDVEVPSKLLLPLARSLATNWSNGNRREAGVVLAHLTGSGHEASSIVSSMSRCFKKVDPVRLLEAHMASLRQSYDDWMDNEPEEISDRPTEEEMAQFEQDEKGHLEQFQALEHQASRLSMSLGVGKLSDPKLSPALLGFMREGVRFAFSTSDADDSADDLVLGSRLSFLAVLSKYANWIKRNKRQRTELQDFLEEREVDLRDHPEFEEVHEDDLSCLSAFRVTLGLTPTIGRQPDEKELSPGRSIGVDGESMMEEDAEERDRVGDMTTTPSSSVLSSAERKSSLGRSSIASLRSRVSSVGRSSIDLSPLYERDGREEDESTSSTGGMASRTTPGSRGEGNRSSQATYDGPDSIDGARGTQNTIESSSDDGEDESVDSEFYRELKKRRK